MLSRFASRRSSWILLAMVATATLAYGTLDDDSLRTNAERSADLASTIACPTCDGQAASDSNAPAAVQVRAEIKRLVDAGYSDGEIRSEMVASYGEFIDLSPSKSGFVGTVWIVPFVAAGLAIGGLVIAFGRWRAMGVVAEATAEDKALVAQARDERAGGDPVDG